MRLMPLKEVPKGKENRPRINQVVRIARLFTFLYSDRINDISRFALHPIEPLTSAILRYAVFCSATLRNLPGSLALSTRSSRPP